MESLTTVSPATDRARNVVLIGFMGSGKTSVGRMVADSLGLGYVDTDSMIEKTAGCGIPSIFEKEGESGFRHRESLALRELVNGPSQVIATGGGIVTVPENIPVLRQLGFVVWLDSDEEVIWRRVSRNQNRPLLYTAQPRQTIHDLLAFRRPLYAAVSDMRVDSTHLSLEETAYGVAESARHFFSEIRK
jgi:shikimate kinase